MNNPDELDNKNEMKNTKVTEIVEDSIPTGEKDDKIPEKSITLKEDNKEIELPINGEEKKNDKIERSGEMKVEISTNPAIEEIKEKNEEEKVLKINKRKIKNIVLIANPLNIYFNRWREKAEFLSTALNQQTKTKIITKSKLVFKRKKDSEREDNNDNESSVITIKRKKPSEKLQLRNKKRISDNKIIKMLQSKDNNYNYKSKEEILKEYFYLWLSKISSIAPVDDGEKNKFVVNKVKNKRFISLKKINKEDYNKLDKNNLDNKELEILSQIKDINENDDDIVLIKTVKIKEPENPKNEKQEIFNKDNEKKVEIRKIEDKKPEEKLEKKEPIIKKQEISKIKDEIKTEKPEILMMIKKLIKMMR